MRTSLSTRLQLLGFSLSAFLAFTVNGFIPSSRFGITSLQRIRPFTQTDPVILLHVSTSPSQSIASEESADEETDYSDDLPLPWTKFQAWALNDNLPRYVVSIPAKRKGGTKQELYGLWRTMSREVTELSGYPVEMLQKMYTRQLNATDDAALPVTPGVLPLLDEFEFEASGGLSGRVYGIAGVADGTKIETAVVKDIHFTVPKGYVQTEKDCVAYELGLPLRDFYSLDGTTGKAFDISKAATNAASGLAKGVAASTLATTEEDPDTMLVRLGASTAVLLAGATAVSMLSHHLTVNVFWV